MIIKDLFAKDINRDINGVVKVAQEDDAATRQELEEYVVTRELRRRFGDFFGAYEAALDRPTDKIGVWISGFFGSGKSHFLKMLSYLLSNKMVDGKPAIDYFIDPVTGKSKFGDPLMDAQVRRCVDVPTESILFNIDNKGPSEKDKTAILKVFARVFYEHLGYYGEDIHLVRLEQFIDAQNKRDEFRAAFERINGGSWLDERVTYKFNSDDLIEALSESGVMSRDEATRWAEGETTTEISIDTLTDEIRDYVERRAAEEGGKFRLLFCVDEVGQYIGSDVNLMLNLQTLVEELGTKCAGRVWVIVTSQEAIDEVTKVVGNDFSKIQGRFNTRLSLSSSSVDEVIKRRVLEKTETAHETLALEYEQQQAVLRNLFTFEDSKNDLIGYESSNDFVDSYPFVSYQFKVMQNVFTEIRKHGSSGKHLASGERSMLSGFQEAAQDVEENGVGTLVPFSLFYDTVQNFLDGGIRRVIDRCQDAADKAQGLEPFDVSVLKLLFLIRYIDDIKSNINNIAILMTDSIDVDKVAMREQVKGSLDRLVRENYVSRSGDVYTFLTDEEQDIARAIHDTPVDTAQITRKIGAVVFDEIFPNKKLRVGKGDCANDFPIDRYVDEAVYGNAQNGLKLRFMTALSDVEAEGGAQRLILRSANGEAICVLKDTAYYDALEEASRIERYIMTQNVQVLSATTRLILDNRRKEQRQLEVEAAELLKRAIQDADFYVAGTTFMPRSSGAAARLTEALETLVENVYTKLNYIDHNVRDDAEVLAIARGAAQSFDGLEANKRALEDVSQYLEVQHQRHLEISMQELQHRYNAIPYGWREIDIAAVVAALIASQRAQIRYQGQLIAPTNSALADLLRQRNKVANVKVEQRVIVSEAQRAQAQRILKEIFPQESFPLDEDGLTRSAKAAFEQLQKELQDLLDREFNRSTYINRRPYPGRLIVEQGIKLCKTIVAQANDPAAFIKTIRDNEDDLYDFSDDIGPVRQFFNGGQREWFDRADELISSINASERTYFAGNSEVEQALATISEVLAKDDPYKQLKDIPACVNMVEQERNTLLAQKRNDILDQLSKTFDEIESAAQEEGVTLSSAGDRRLALKNLAHGAKSLTELDTIPLNIATYRDEAYREIERRKAAREKPKPATTSVTVTDHVVHEQPIKEPLRPTPEPKRIKLSNLCRPRTLYTPDDIQAYVEDLRTRLNSELTKNNDDGIFVS